MKIPLSWLKEYLDLPFSAEKIAEMLTVAGIEVDDIESIGNTFSGVVTAKILDSKPHPNADRLSVATVFDGIETVQVVCGAQNCKAGMITAFAKIGASLKDEDKVWKIKKSKIRDIESFGMLCTAGELHIPGSAEEIIKFPESQELGVDCETLYSDTIFTISLTPNLGHCMSIYGIARELSAFFKKPLKKIETSPSKKTLKNARNFIDIQIADPRLCQRYSSCLIQSLEVGPSPDWLVKKLELTGTKSINNVVDISNYIMILTGQPLHFFDYDLIKNQKIYISTCQENARVLTLDGVERTLPQDTIVIKDSEKIIAIAGVMGAKNTEVSKTTKNILIEAALFNPISIRKTGRALNLKTEASNRFEKGIDIEGIPLAMQLAVDLLSQIANGNENVDLLDLYEIPVPPKKISCRVERANKMLGTSLSLGEISDLLGRLQITTLKETVDSLEVLVPSYRNDLKEEIDIIEEIARLYGFNNIPVSSALHVSSSLLDSPIFTAENKARELLLREGLQEFLTCDLMSPRLAELTLEKNDKITHLISALQCKSSDYSVLRPSLLPCLLQLVKYNCDHQNRNISGFEVGRIHFKESDFFQEQTSIGVILSGETTPHHHCPKPREVDFYDLKGIIENLLDGFKIKDISFSPSHLSNFQPGKQARIKSGDISLGVIGEIHPKNLTELDLSQRVFFAEINLQSLIELSPKTIKVQELPLMPASERDWTVTLKKDVRIDEVLSCITAHSPVLLEKVFLLDLFESEKIGLDRKNATWRFIYRDKIKTVDFETVEKEHSNLIQKVAEKLGNCIL